MMMHTNIVMDLAKKVPYQDGDGSCSNAATGHAWEATASIDGGSWCGSRGEVMSLGQLCKPDLKLVVQLATENPKTPFTAAVPGRISTAMPFMPKPFSTPSTPNPTLEPDHHKNLAMPLRPAVKPTPYWL